MRCNHCQAEPKKPTEKLPRGWKSYADQVWCDRCWKASWSLRAITIPVVRPLGEGVGWPQLREALTLAWSQTTSCVNWLTSQTWSRDEQRMPGQDNLAKMPKTYLYPEAVARFPELPTNSVSTLAETHNSKYLKRRYKTLWTCEICLPNARYPQPFTVPNQGWTPCYRDAGKEGGDKVPCVKVTILRGQRFTLQLKGGQEFRRQLGDFAQLVDGRAVLGSLDILRLSAKSSKGNGVKDRDGGGQNGLHRVMVKMVGWFPKKIREAKGTLYVRTDADSFLVALDEKGAKLRIWNADHVRQWISEHSRQLNRWSDDQKAEQRPVASFQSKREAAALKFRNRINSFQKETVAQVVGVARRMKFAAVQYDDRDHVYFGDRFDWSGFKMRLENKLNENGITLLFASDEVISPTTGVTRE